MSSGQKVRIISGIFVAVVLIIGGYLYYLYQRGGVEHYRPPAAGAESPKSKVLSDLASLSQAIDAYYVKNLRYPGKLDQLKPEFIDQIPMEPGTGKPFAYESDGPNHYQIVVSNPTVYGLKELRVKDGKIIQN